MRLLVLAIFTVSLLSPQATTPHPRKRILAIGDVHRKNYQHDAVSHALATIERLGYESGIYDTYIRTDIQLLTKHPIQFAEKATVVGAYDNYKTLNDFDLVFFFGIGELELTDQQKADLLSFVRDDGKGFVATHTAVNAFFTWPEFGELLGARFDDHPWMIIDAPVIVEDPAFPAMKAFPRRFVARDEIYQMKDFSREHVRVLARIDENKVDLKNPRVHRTDGDFALAWAHNYGNGRVFYSAFGHTTESWDNPAMQKMWLEAIKWGLKLTNGDATPRPRPLPVR